MGFSVNSIKHYDQKGAAISSFKLSILTISITVLILWYLIWSKPDPEVDLQEIAPLKVVTTQVLVKDISPYERVTGRLQPIKTAEMRFEVTGVVQVREIEPGYRVEQGQALLALDARDYRDDLIQREAALEIEQQTQARDRQLLQLANSNLALQEQELDRVEQIAAKNLIAQSQVDTTRQIVFDLRAEVAQLRASEAMSEARIMQQKSLHDIAQRNLQRTTLRAPFTGIVNEIFFDHGDYVNANEIALSIIDTDQLDLQLDIRGELMHALKLDQSVQVFVDDKQLIGKVVALQSDPDADTHTHQLRVRIPGEALYPGELATANIPLTIQKSALVIPVAAVLNQYGSSYVFVMQENRVSMQEVELGKRIKNEYIVISGLQRDQEIVARDVVSLSDEQIVLVE